MHCRSCGQPLAANVKFCKGCGTKVQGAGAASRTPRKKTSTASRPKQAARGAQTAQRAVRTQQVTSASKSPGGIIGWIRALSGWDAAAVFGGAGGAVLWYLYSRLDRGAPPDTVTPLLIVAIPVGIVVFRGIIDRVLTPIQKIRQRIPKAALIGAGLVVPYLVSQALYNYNGLREFPYVRVCIVVGTILSYIILRTPKTARSKR